MIVREGHPTPEPRTRFDAEAETFDARTGLPPEVPNAVAAALRDMLTPTPASVVVEIGAGTGSIGLHLARLPVRYVGLDLSMPMLRVFRDKLTEAPGGVLTVEADCNRTWPIEDGVADAVFASRAIHLLDPSHVIAEVGRVCAPGGALVIGRVVREPQSLRSRLRRQRRALLEFYGMPVQDGARETKRLLERSVAGGAAVLADTRVCTWTGTTDAERVIAGWETKSSLGRHEVSPDVRAAIFRDLRAWAAREIGDLERPEEFSESYTLGGVRLPSRGETRAQRTVD